MALNPQFASVPKLGAVTISTPNTNRNGSGTIDAVLTAGANGTRVRRLAAVAIGATTAGVVRFWLHNGTAALLLREVIVPAVTPSVTQAVFSVEMTETTNPELLPITLPTGWSIRASTQIGESFVAIAGGADL